MTGLVLLGGMVPASAQTLTWSVVHSPNRRAGGNFLDAVSCVSATMCMATGHRLAGTGAVVTLAERWDGTSWSLVRTRNPSTIGNELVALSCASAAACMAVGFTQGGPGGPLAESWKGSRWSVLPTPNPGTGGNFLNGVSCVSPDTCTAAGEAFHSGTQTTSLIESWDGSRWSVVPSPTPGTGQTLVNGVSCSSKDACNVVGSYNNETKTLVESWDGRSWSVVPTPNPGAIDRALDGVSCVSPGFCMAAGWFLGRNSISRTLTLLGTAPG